ncbi:MAG TPA: histidine--tRNA ligase [Rhodospirillales bacterium]|jgi:histidyl-tRNA synthetase|nr:histidine--tRNA ligase [Rhodospirillales bacterium]
MPSLQPVRGTYDILPEAMRRHRWVEETAHEVAGRYGYAEIATPLFEFQEVFTRTLGKASDIVTKEMYIFEDKNGESLALRPENTAGVARAFITNGMAQKLPLKFFCRGPMFRYERPQKGRQRQFHQIGVELLGVAQPLGDVEVIALGADFLAALGIEGKVTCEVNSLGDAESRKAYRDKLVDYLSQHRSELSADSRTRLTRNPLRILDSKDQNDRTIVAGAPLLSDSLNDVSRQFFDDLLEGLDTAGISFRINPRLVRGLDYYCHTAFEFTTDTLGAQGALIAGGRYDGLIDQMGGAPTPGTGWAAGVERLSMMIDDPPPTARPIAVVPVDEGTAGKALALTQRLRRAGFTVDQAFSGNMRKRMKHANKVNARVSLLLGEDELARQAATVRDMESGEQTQVPLDAIEDHLARYR